MSLAHLPRIAPGHAHLVATLDGLTDDACRAPSRLPGWSRGHLLTHLARNADAVARLTQGLIDDVPGVMYPDGPEGRNRDIEAGSSRSALELISDVAISAAKLQVLLPLVSDEAWATKTVRGVTRDWPATNVPWMRRREIETHLVDLDLGVSFDDLPTDYLQAELELAKPRLEEAGQQSYIDKANLPTVVAWVLGRTTPEGWPPLSWG